MAEVGVNSPTDETDARPYNESKATRHLRGWLSYAFASEVFVIVSLTMFLPICLEQFARDNGVFLPDKTESCSSSAKAPDGSAAREPAEELRCVVQIGWAWIDTASFSLYVNSISVALQALTVISMGSIANAPRYRKTILLLFAALGSISAMLFITIPSNSPIWAAVALFAITANVGFGASVVALNAYLPILAKEDKEVVLALMDLQRSENEDHAYNAGATTDREANDQDEHDEPLLANSTVSAKTRDLREKYLATLSRKTASISGTGIALGYFAGIVALILTLVPVIKSGGSTLALRAAIAASGAWWAFFTLPVWVWLPNGSGPDEMNKDWTIGQGIIDAWKRLGQMLTWQEIMKLKNTFLFLAAWFLLSDGFTTITSTALLFGKTRLHMSASALILVGVLVNTMGIAGALAWPRIQRYFSWSNKRVLVLLVIMCSMIPAYGCVGFLPVFRQSSSDASMTSVPYFGGLTTQGEMFGLGVYFGFLYGAFQAYARAFYADLIPPGEEARWYALYSITDKSSSFVGPLVAGLIADATGNIRYAFFFLIAMIWAAVPLLLSVNVSNGREDAQRYVRQPGTLR